MENVLLAQLSEFDRKYVFIYFAAIIGTIMPGIVLINIVGVLSDHSEFISESITKIVSISMALLSVSAVITMVSVFTICSVGIYYYLCSAIPQSK